MAGDYPEDNLPPSGWMAARLGTYEFPIILQAVNGAHTVRLHGSMDINDCHYLYIISLDFVTDPDMVAVTLSISKQRSHSDP